MQPGIKIQLPTAVSTDRIEEKEVFISVSAEGIVFVGEKQIALDQLESLLKPFGSSDAIVIIKGDEKTPHGKIVKIMDIAKKAGIEKIAIATMPELESLQ